MTSLGNRQKDGLILGLNHEAPAPPPAAWLRSLVWLTLAVSCIVFIEPAPYDILVLLLIVILFPMGLRVPREIGVALLLLMLFGAANLAAALTAGDLQEFVRPLATRSYMLFAWLFWTSLVVADPPHFLRIIWRGYAFAALLAVAWAILQYFGYLPESLGVAFGRAQGPFKDANVFAPFLVPIILYYIARMLRVRGAALALESIKFLPLILGLFLGFSRGAWLNFSVAFLLYMVFSSIAAQSLKEQMRLMVVVTALGLVAVLAVTLAVTYTTAGQLFAERAAIVQDYDTAQGGRFDTQAKALTEIGKNPVGIGPGMTSTRFGLEPHNLYLHVAVEGGWIGGMSFYLFLIVTLTRGLARINTVSPLRGNLQIVVAALIGTLAQSLFIDSTHWRHLWLLLALTWAITISIDRDMAHVRRLDYVQSGR